MTHNNITVNVGDIITIKAQGKAITGKVHSANHYGERDGWYIELTESNCGGYNYWKQGQDGGNIVMVNNKRVDTVNTVSGEMVRRMFGGR